jgi:hypothetical protein
MQLTIMQVKLFVHHSADEAETSLNKWLVEHDVDIEYIGQSQSEKGGKFVFIISLFYKPKAMHQQLRQIV